MKTNSRRVVLTTTASITASAFLPQLVLNLSRDHEVHVISSPGDPLESLAERFTVVVHRLPMSREISPVADCVAFARWVALLVRLRPHLVVSMTPKASLLAMVASWLVRTPQRVYLLVGLRLEGERGPIRRILTYIERITSGAATVVIANSPSLREAAVEQGLVARRKIATTLPGSSHGVDTNYFSPRPPDSDLARRLGLRPDYPVIGFVGRVTRDKGLDTLLAASAIMNAQGSPHQLLIVGAHDEPDSSTYVQRLKDARVNVVLVEVASDVRPYFALMDVHVLPTLREGFPNVVLEASAMAVTTVTTVATGAVDSVRDGETGLLVSPGNHEELALAVSTLLINPKLRAAMGEAARAWVTEEFEPSNVTAALLHAAGVRRP